MESEKGNTGGVSGHPHFPLWLGSFCAGAAHVTCKQDCISELEHLSFILALLLESIETVLCLLSICVSQSKFQITFTFVLRRIDFIKLHCSFVSFILWNPNIASIPLSFFLVGLFALKSKTLHISNKNMLLNNSARELLIDAAVMQQ